MKKFTNLICFSALLVSGSYLSAAEPFASVRLVSHEPYYFENSFILLDKVNSQSTTVFIDVESSDGMASRFIVRGQACNSAI